MLEQQTSNRLIKTMPTRIGKVIEPQGEVTSYWERLKRPSKNQLGQARKDHTWSDNDMMYIHTSKRFKTFYRAYDLFFQSTKNTNLHQFSENSAFLNRTA